MRIGHGYDVHRFSDDDKRRLVIGGVYIQNHRGLIGHSDADVLTHAVADALLGAAAMRDIGYHFPDNDPSYKNINSMVLLSKTVSMLRDRGYAVANIDATVIAETPRISPYIEEMRSNLASSLDINVDLINIKATTEEGLGFTGQHLGIAAHAVCLIYETRLPD